MRTFLILIILVAVCIFGISSFYFSQEQVSGINLITNLVSALSSLITLWFALLIYSKYGVEKSILNKQTETVLKFLEKLKSTKFIVTDKKQTIFISLRIDNLKSLKEDKHLIKYLDHKLLINSSYITELRELFEYRDNLYLPKTISSQFKSLDLFILEQYKGDYSEYLLLYLPNNDSRHIYGKFNQKDLTFLEFVKMWESVTNATLKWIREKSNFPVALNFQQ